jgi:hypothetical protein
LRIEVCTLLFLNNLYFFDIDEGLIQTHSSDEDEPQYSLRDELRWYHDNLYTGPGIFWCYIHDQYTQLRRQEMDVGPRVPPKICILRAQEHSGTLNYELSSEATVPEV